MNQVRRLYVEKKPDYAVAAKELMEDIHNYLDIRQVERVRVLIRYDLENITDATYDMAKMTVFAEPPVDELYEDDFPKKPQILYPE